MRQITIADILTDAEIAQARSLFRELGHTGRFAKTLRKELIESNMARINTNLGQENDAAYLAYAVEHVLFQVGGGND